MQNLVIGASLKPYRYSNMAIKRLLSHHHEVKAIGLKEGEIDGVKILTGKPPLEDIDTVLMYINIDLQPDFYDYILGLKPRRIIFNPGTENPEFQKMAKENGIEPIQACSLVMMSIGSY